MQIDIHIQYKVETHRKEHIVMDEYWSGVRYSIIIIFPFILLLYFVTFITRKISILPPFQDNFPSFS